MRKEENRKKVKKLFILGAGASFSLTKQSLSNVHKQAPLDREFCERIVKLKGKVKWISEAQQRIKKDWKDHNSFIKLGLEEAIIKQIGHFDFLKSIHSRRSHSRTINEYFYDIIHLIVATLDKAEEKDTDIVKRFIKHIFSGTDYTKQKNRVITFNYDTIIDKHLYNKFKLTEIYFDRILTEASEAQSKRSGGKIEYPLLIKLHGSINWHVKRQDLDNILNNEKIECVKRNTTTFDTSDCYFIEKILKKDSIPSPSDESTPLILPPMPQKPITNIAIFRYLWTYAYEYLHECEEIIICGYSFPETDTLAESMFSNFSNKHIKKITIIDPNPTVIKKWKDLFSRNNLASKVVWEYYDDFVEYIEIKCKKKSRKVKK